MTDVQNDTTEQTSTPENANVAEFMNHFDQMKSQVSDATQKLNEYVDGQNREAVNKEVSDAAGRINEKVGGDAEMAELFLEKQYANNPDLKKLWDNRKENPDALNAALDTVAEEWASKNTNVVDSQVAENQRALKESQTSGGAVQETDQNAVLDKMSDGEFLSHMRAMRSS